MSTIKLLSTAEVAKILGLAPSTLSTMRRNGTGPRCVWVTDHSPRYTEEDVAAFIEERAS